jgi:deubiquitinase DESI2
MYWAGIGIFHSGIEVYGIEYAFGGHEYDAPGVFATEPRDAPGAIFRESIELGPTSLSPDQVYSLVQELGRTKYKGNAYHLLQLNCNNFANDLCMKLTGKEAPGWINRLAGLAIAMHCLLPQGLIPPLKPPTAVSEAEHLHIGPGEKEERKRLLLNGDSGSGSRSNGGVGKAPPRLIT